MQMDTVYSIAVSPNFKNDGVCFAACQSGLFKSSDWGDNWTNTFDSLNPAKPLPTSAVVISPNYEKDQMVFAAVAGTVMYSSDGGKSWEASMLSASDVYISYLAISPSFEEDGFVIAGTMEDGVFISSDRGKTWKQHNFGLLDLNILCIEISPNFQNDETIYLGSESGVYISRNTGLAWKETNFPVESGPVLSMCISPHYEDDSIVFAGTESHGIFRLSNKGKKTDKLGNGLSVEGINSIILSPLYPSKSEILIATGNKLFISFDDGKSWLRFKEDIKIENEILDVVAPLGFNKDKPLFIGLSEIGIVKINF